VTILQLDQLFATYLKLHIELLAHFLRRGVVFCLKLHLNAHLFDRLFHLSQSLEFAVETFSFLFYFEDFVCSVRPDLIQEVIADDLAVPCIDRFLHIVDR
jgi:hypothetical protein